MTEGKKFDLGKPEYGLLPPAALEEVVKVLTFGAQKYSRENWRQVPDASRRYFDALNRHIWAWKRGETKDPESGMHHLAHAVCCALFLMELGNKPELSKEVLDSLKDSIMNSKQHPILMPGPWTNNTIGVSYRGPDCSFMSNAKNNKLDPDAKSA